MNDSTRRTFVAAASLTAAASRAQALAIDGGPKSVKIPDAQHSAATKWPRYGQEEKTAILDLLDSNRFYQEIPLLEEESRKYLGIDYAKAQINGTSALMSMFFALGLPAGSEIMVPTYTASASVAPMRFFGYVPVFVDIRPDTATFDVEHARRVLTPRTRALVVMHSWGLPCDMDAVQAFAKEKGLILLEDAAQAQGAKYHGRHVGTLGVMGMYSYQMSKVLPAVEGGLGVYHSREHYERATAFGNYDLPQSFPADSKYRKYHDTGFGPKFRIHPLAAALARQQLRKLDGNNRLVAKQVEQLNSRLTQLPGLSMQKVAPGMERVYWAANLLLFDAAKAGVSKDAIIKALRAEGVKASGGSYPEQHKFALYREPEWWHHAPTIPDVLPGAAQVNEQALRLPLFTAPAGELIEQYTAAFEKVWARRAALKA